jgi:glycosyltransferase involved in cell wall biosynthesis
MKIIINTSNLYVGGGLQVALSFINELKTIQNTHEYFVFLSLAIEKQLDQDSFSNKFHFYRIDKSPSLLKTRKEVVKQLNTLEEEIQPDVVFSVFGPPYWKPKSVHLVGFADGWVYNQASIAYKKLSLLKRLKMRLHTLYKAYYLKRDADCYVLETEDAKEKIVKMLHLNKECVFVVGNTYSNSFKDKSLLDRKSKYYVKLPERNDNEFRFIYIAHNHVNKNLTVIKEIIPLLQKYNIKFILTLNSEVFERLFKGFEENIINIGPIEQAACPSIYSQADALFAPTLLETFSASYPEAMKMEKPILTSNYSFAKDVCKDAALYFDPLDPEDIAKKIKQLIVDKSLQNELIDKGTKRLKEFETANSRAKKYIEICENIFNKSKGNKNV